MSDAKLQISRKQLATICHDDPEAIRLMERLFASVDVLQSVQNAGFIFGLQTANNGVDTNNDIDVAEGRATSDGSTPVMMILTSAITKRLDANWSSGTGGGGLDTGSKAVSTTYHVFLISNGSGADILLSASATAPTLPSGYVYKRRISSIMTDSSGNIVGFVQRGDRFDLKTITQVYSGAISGQVTVTAYSPKGIKTISRVALGGAGSTSGGYYVQIYPKYQTALAAGAGQVGSGSTSGADNAGGYAEVETDTLGQFYAHKVTGSGTWSLRVISLGWIDRRGQDE